MWKRIKNWLAGRGRPTGPRFIIHERYQLDISFTEYDSSRPFRILRYLRGRHLLRRGMLLRPRSVSLHRLQRVHDPDYIRSLEEPGALEPILGTPVDLETQDRFLAFQRIMCGGTLQASHNALQRNEVAVNLGGGLHHAGRDRGSGFCVFNDVAIAIAFLRDLGHEIPILVIDLDLHDGDGTREIFAADDTVHTFSIHNHHLGNGPAVASTSIALGADVDDETYLEAIHSHLTPVFQEFRPGLVIYLAGSDPGVDDRLGDWRISLEGMLQRDRLVMDLCRPPGGQPLPTVILLAGGYGPLAWRHGAAFFSWLLSGTSKLDIPLELELPVDHYRQLARLMRKPRPVTVDRPDPTSGLPRARPEDDWGLNEQDLGGSGVAPDTLFLGVYSRHGIELALEESGLMDRMRQMGFRALRVAFDLDDPLGHTMSIRSGTDKRRTILEMKLRIDRRMVPNRKLLAVEWLSIQDTRSSFELSRPLLPGQEYPGLGMLRDIAAVLVVVCERRDLDGLVFTPTHFHLARLARPMGSFGDPAQQGRMLALQHAVRNLRLAEAARAVDRGRIVDAATGKPALWIPSPMIIPVTEPLKELFTSREYLEKVTSARRDFSFRLTPS